MLRFANCCKVAQWLIWVTEYGCRLPGLPRLPRLPPAFFYGENAFNNIYIIKLLYIAQFQKKNTRGVTEVTAVTRATEGYWGWLRCLLRRVIGASGYSGYQGYRGYLLPFFMGKMLLIILYIIKLLYIAQFQKKKHTWGNRGNQRLPKATETDWAAYSGGW